MEIVNKIMEKVEELKDNLTKTEKNRTVNEDNKDNKEEPKEDLEPVCLLFPTYANRNADGEWNIRVRGWAFCAPKKSKTRSLFLGLTSLALQKDDERFQFLESRTSWFWTNNISQGDFTVQVDGLTESNKMSIEGDPNDEGPVTTTVEPHGEGSTTTTTNITVPKVGALLGQAVGQAGKMITNPLSNPLHPDSELTHTKITPKSGHFNGGLSIHHDIINKWIGEENQETVVSGFINKFAGSKDKDRTRLLKIKVFQSGTDEPHFGVVNLVEPDGVSIISDIDDTIKDTDILRGAKKVLSNTFLQPFKEVPGMPEIYRKFYEKGAAIHYVSNSPWQLFPSLRSFFQTYNFPPGSAHFKFYDGLIKSAYEQKENPMASKFMYIRELLKDFPKRKFVLIGDTGELDPEIYTTIARENPGRILRIYVRDVTTKHVEGLPPEKPKHSYTRTFPTIYNYLRSYYGDEENKEGGEEDKEAENTAADVITQQAAAATSGETREVITDPKKPERKSSLTNRLLDKLHLDMSYLYGTALTDTPDSIDDNNPTPPASKPKTPLKLLSPAKLSKLRTYSLKSDKNSSKSEDKTSDSNLPQDVEDDKEDEDVELKTPLEMFHERLKLLREGLEPDIFHTFTDVKDLENDTAIKAELKY